jgi:hypothetical protein
MMKNDLIKELSYLPTLDLTDFNTIERGLKYNLRFELGDPFENGTNERVNQATNRATELFENFISSDLNIYLIIYDFSDEMFAITPNHIYELMNSNTSEIDQFEETLATRYFENETIIERVKGKITLYRTKRNKIKYREIFKGIANTEMGFTPTIHQLVYIFEPESKKWFWMYDDRGCLLFSNEILDLKQILKKFDHWIVESQRQEMEKQFD